MVAKQIFEILLCMHVLGDFYFQTEKMAEDKKSSVKVLGKHIILYGIVGGCLLKVLIPSLPMVYILAFAIAHGGIDGIKYASGKRAGSNVFLIDQFAHLLVILGITYFVITRESALTLHPWIIDVAVIFDIEWTSLLSWTIKLVLLHKPANILIGVVLQKYKPIAELSQAKQGDEPNNMEEKKAGRYIGTLERLIMVLLISLEQYSAVGLVLTAKSIARYDKISKEQTFAEYYLLGTLLSALCAIIVATIF